MDLCNIFSVLSEEYSDIEQEIIYHKILKKELDLQDRTAEDGQYVFDLDEYYVEPKLLNVANFGDTNEKHDNYTGSINSYTDQISVTAENDVLFVHIDPCPNSSDTTKESYSNDEFILNLDDYYSEMKALNDTIHNERNDFVEYNLRRDVTEVLNATKPNDSVIDKDSDPSESNFKINEAACATTFIDVHHTTDGSKHRESVSIVDDDVALPNLNAIQSNKQINDTEIYDSSDDEPLASIKKEKELKKYTHEAELNIINNNDVGNLKIEATTLRTDSIGIKFVEHPTPSTSRGYSKVDVNNNLDKDDEDSIGYHSSDFEFISESESELVGFIENKRRRSKLPNRQFEVSIEDYREQRKKYKIINNDYRKDHVIPRGNDYLDMFRLYVPLCSGYMENKAFHVTSMNTEFEGIGFDLNLMPRYDEREDEEHIAEANEAAKYIERMYPNENRRRRRRQI